MYPRLEPIELVEETLMLKLGKNTIFDKRIELQENKFYLPVLQSAPISDMKMFKCGTSSAITTVEN